MVAFLAIVVVIAGIIGYGAFAQSRADRATHIYRNLAKRFRGQHSAAGWFSKPNVRFRYGPTHALVSTTTPYGRRGPHFSQVLISWPDHDLRCEIFPSSNSPFDTEKTDGEYRLGDEDFCSKYVVRTSDVNRMTKFLSDGVQWQINSLRRFFHDDIYVQIENGRLLVRKNGQIKRYDHWEDFVNMALELYDQGMLTRAVGIEFGSSESQAKEIHEANCQVCGENITTDMVFCRRCKTPHHSDCWQYFGECSVYGCGEKRCVAPKVAGPG